MNPYAEPWELDYDEPECPDVWHVTDDGEDVCPTCGYRIGGADD